MKKLFMSLALVALFVSPVLADGDSMEGSYCELVGPPVGYIGETTVVEVWHWNGSPDNEWTAQVDLIWPGCVDVLDGWYSYDGANPEPVFDFEAIESMARFTDGDEGFGEIYPDDGCTFFVEIFLTDVCIPTIQTVNYLIVGDIWGDPPHEVEGTFEFPVEDAVASENSTWSAVKGLYR